MQTVKLDERWTPTTLHATFLLRQPPSTPRRTSVHLPLLKFGWSFTLSFVVKKASPAYRWIPTGLSFRQQDNSIPWGNTSLHARLSCATHDVQEHVNIDAGTPTSLLGAITVALADTSQVQPLSLTPCTFPSRQPIKIWLTVTISECPFANGLFEATSYHSEVEAQAQLIRQSGDRVLGRSLTTGEFFDVKFLSFSVRPTPGNTGELLPTHASLSVVETHLSLPDSKLKEEWASALAALKTHDNAGVAHLNQVLCPEECEYELDSDFEDEEQVSFTVPDASTVPCERNLIIVVDDNQPEGTTVGTSGTSDQGPLEELAECSREPFYLSPEALADYERTVVVKFAAHRTWHAFLWYCYTGRVEFNKLKSQVEPGVRRLCLSDQPPTCSPKSMYRLADLMGEADLKAKALQAICEQMTEANILDETVSIFTSKYPTVREVQLGILLEYCGSPEVKRAFFKAMQRLNDMPHAEPVLSAFYDQLVG